MKDSRREEFLDLLGHVDEDILIKAIDMDDPEMTKRRAHIHMRRWKHIVWIAAALLLLAGSLTALGMGPLRDTWMATILFGNGSNEIVLESNVKLLDIRDDAPKTRLDVTLTQAEGITGIPFLSSSWYTSDAVYYRPWVPYQEKDPKGRRLGKGKEIERIDLWYPRCVVMPDGGGHISCSITLFTTHASENTILAGDGLDATGGKTGAKTCTLETLGVEAVLYRTDWDEERITAALIHNDVYYAFIGEGVSEERMEEFLHSLQ